MTLDALDEHRDGLVALVADDATDDAMARRLLLALFAHDAFTCRAIVLTLAIFWRASRIRCGLVACPEIGRAHVCTPVNNAQLVGRLLLENEKSQDHNHVHNA